MKKLVYTIQDAMKVFPSFFTINKLNRLNKMSEYIKGIPKKIYLCKFVYKSGTESYGYLKRKIDLRQSHCHVSRRTWSSGLNYTRKRSKLAPLKIRLFICFDTTCRQKFLDYLDGRNTHHLCYNCANNNKLLEKGFWFD